MSKRLFSEFVSSHVEIIAEEMYAVTKHRITMKILKQWFNFIFFIKIPFFKDTVDIIPKKNLKVKQNKHELAGKIKKI